MNNKTEYNKYATISLIASSTYAVNLSILILEIYPLYILAWPIMFYFLLPLVGTSIITGLIGRKSEKRKVAKILVY